MKSTKNPSIKPMRKAWKRPTNMPTTEVSTPAPLETPTEIYCLLVNTGQNDYKGGNIKVLVDSGDGEYIPTSTPGKDYVQSQVVLDKCFATIEGV